MRGTRKTNTITKPEHAYNTKSKDKNIVGNQNRNKQTGHKLVLFLLFLLVVGTQLILSLVPRLLVSILVPIIFCCLLTLYYTHVQVFPTSGWFTLSFSFFLVYSTCSRHPSVPVLWSLMCLVSLSVGSTINYYNPLTIGQMKWSP